MDWRVGLIGLDGHQGQILDGIAQMEPVQLMAIVSDNARAIEAIRRHAAVMEETRFYTDHKALLRNEQLDIVGLCDVNGERVRVLEDCARAGIHLVSEKPLVTTLEDLERVRKVIEDSSVHLSMLLTMRFERSYQAAKTVVEEGCIGEPILANAQKSYRLGERPEWMKHRSSFGGTIPFIGIHALDLIRWVSGRTFTEVMAYHSNAGNPQIKEMEDNATILVKLDNGGTACAHLDYLRPAAAPSHGDDALRIAGTKGIVEVRWGKATLLDDQGGPRDLPLPEADQLFVNFVEGLEGKRKAVITADDAYEMTEICLKAREAADTGNPMPL